MKPFAVKWTATAVFILVGLTFAVDNDDNLLDGLPEDRVIVKALIQGDMEGSLLDLPDVRQFIEEDLPYFHDVEFRNSKDELTELFLLNKKDEVVEFYPMADYDRWECKQLLMDKGFYRRDTEDKEVLDTDKKGSDGDNKAEL